MHTAVIRSYITRFQNCFAHKCDGSRCRNSIDVNFKTVGVQQEGESENVKLNICNMHVELMNDKNSSTKLYFQRFKLFLDS